MPIEYKVFYVNIYECDNFNIAVEKMNELITSKMNEGWKPVGGISFLNEGGSPLVICQAMTLE